MNNAGTVLLTLADMSVIQAEVEVDETNIPNVQLGQTAKITIDALPDRTFKGHVTEIGNSPIQATGGAAGDTQATNFKVVVVLDEPVPDVRPGFTCTADITTATRTNVDGGADSGRRGPRAGLRRQRPGRQEPPTRHERRRRPTEPVAAAAELEAGPDAQGDRRRVRRARAARAEFVPIKMGIAGDKYFEVLSGLEGRRPGDHRPVQLGARHGRRRRGEGGRRRSRAELRQTLQRRTSMNKFLESAGIALEAIWAAKLRSFMTVLGNIVAVTSIIAVVSLIQGLNASVKEAILNQAGADSFSIQQFPITRSDEEFEKVRYNPRHHAAGRARDPAATTARCIAR